MTYNFADRGWGQKYRLLHTEEGNLFCGNYMANGNWQEPKLMQFTGLLDKNGKEIYEGDILDLHPEENDKIWHRKIIWDTAAFHCVQIHGKANYPLHFNKYTPDKIWVIIGNIYQNPELL